MTILYIIIIMMNAGIITFVMSLPLLRILSKKRLKQGYDCKGNCSADVKIGKINIIQSIKLVLSSYHIRYAIKYIGNIPSHRIRNFLYKNIYLLKMGKNVVMYYGAELRSPWNIEIGEGTIVGDNVILDASRSIIIGNNVNISSRASVYSLQHDYRDLNFDCTINNSGKISIGDRVWIGPQAIVLPNVNLGEGCVIAGGAVVTRDVPPFEVWGGIPAKKIGDRPNNINYKFNGFHSHFL